MSTFNKIKKTQLLLLMISISVLACKSNDKAKVDNTCIKNFKLDRYMGTWYEIARLPNSFEKNMVGVTARYTLRDNGKVSVTNSGYLHKLAGEFKSSTGKAKQSKPTSNGCLKVSFFWFFYSDYRILEIDSLNYKYAMVGSSANKYLWILSRTPQLPNAIYIDLIEKAKARGYKTENIIKVKQKALREFEEGKSI